jgi:hypothetical protein
VTNARAGLTGTLLYFFQEECEQRTMHHLKQRDPLTVVELFSSKGNRTQHYFTSRARGFFPISHISVAIAEILPAGW